MIPSCYLLLNRLLLKGREKRALATILLFSMSTNTNQRRTLKLVTLLWWAEHSALIICVICASSSQILSFHQCNMDQNLTSNSIVTS